MDRDIKKLARLFSASISVTAGREHKMLMELQASLDKKEFEKLMGLKPHPRRKMPILKEVAEDGLLFSNYFTHVMRLDENKKRILEPMRYRVRPAGSSTEIPTKYNVFNARIDSLEKRQTWQTLFMRSHGIVPFIKFFEWVEHEGKKRLITFSPEDYEIMWAPVLWDEWQDPTGQIKFKSFAIITDDPPPEIYEMGHDRTPIFLNENCFDDWLAPKNLTTEDAYAILKQKKSTYYHHQWAS